MTQADSSQPVPVAIIGMGCLFPMADDLDRFWSNIRGRLDAISEVPTTHWRPDDYWDDDPKSPDRTYARRGGFLTPVDFPLLDFGISPHAVEATDTTQLLGLLVARQALLDAGYGPDRDFDRQRVSVILGVTGTLELVIPLGARLGHPIWKRALSEAGVDSQTADDVVRRISQSYVGWQENSFPGLLGNVAAGRIANRLDLGGTNCVVDAACASSLGAVNLAMLELAAGRCDVALSGGLDTFNDIFMYMCFSKTPALSPTGNARPFDSGADGTILGEGLGILVFKRLADARRDGDRIYAVIRSMGSSSDGKGQAVYAPSAAGQVNALRQAYDLAGIAPDSIELVEAHGTGTKVGDAIELEALEQVYRGARPGGPWCALGSIKSQVGHTKAAAGAAGLIKTALALYHKVLPPTIKVREPIEPLATGTSPFYLSTEARPWLSNPGHPRRAAVSAFGFGGSNFHCVLEEVGPEMAAIVDWGGDVQIVAYSGTGAAEVDAALPRWTEATTWADVREEAARSRAEFQAGHHARLVMVAQRGATDPARLIAEAKAQLAAYSPEASSPARHPAGGSPRAGQSHVISMGFGPSPGLLAMLFPGQGSQYLGMLRDLACRFPTMLETLEFWNSVAAPGDGLLSDRIYPPPSFSQEVGQRREAELRDTRIAQPAIGAVSVGLLQILHHFGVEPDLAGGHSFGELTALHAAGWISQRELPQLALRRGLLMAESGQAAGPGAMLAVFATCDEAAAFIDEHKLELVVANKNAPRQCVLSGPSSEIHRAADGLAQRGVTCRPLAVSAAFHSPLVAASRQAFREALGPLAFTPGRVPVFANATAAPYPADPDLARDLLADQLCRPVEFLAQVEAMYQSGARTFLEVGPDARLTGLVRSILAGRDHHAIAVDASRGERGEGNLADLAIAFANLAALGYPVRLQCWDEGFRAPIRNSSKKTLTVKVCGANSASVRLTEPGAGADEPQTPVRLSSLTPVGLVQPISPVQVDRNRDSIDRPHERLEPTPAEWTMNPADLNHHPATNGQAATSPAVSHHRPAVSDSTASPPPPAADPPSPALAQAIEQTQANLLALQRLAEQTAELHRQFLEGQATTQRSFHLLLEQQARLTQGVQGRHESNHQPHSRLVSSPIPHDRESPRPVPPTPRLSVHPTSNGVAVAAPHDAVRHSVPTPVPAAAPAPGKAGDEIARTLRAVVADKTGYPIDMLDLDMHLDADLGIDSIKRVEIFSAVQDRLPEAPTVKPEHLGSLRTLRQVAEFLANKPTAALAQSTIPATSPPERNGDLQHSPRGSLVSAMAETLIQVVAEKTGYPIDMLDLDMHLDADLGIDSIKRVEIFSAVQDRLPEAPTVKPEHLGSLRTLRQVAEFLAAQEPAPMGQAEPKSADDDARRLPEPDEWSSPPRHTTRLERLVPTSVPLADPQSRVPLQLPRGSEIWLTDDGSMLTEKLRLMLSARGHAVQVFRLGELPLPASGPDLSGLIILAPTGSLNASFVKDAFGLLRAAAPSLRQNGSRTAAIFLTVSRLDGSFGLNGLAATVDPDSGALAGLAKTARQEWPELECKAIDVEPAFSSLEAAAQRIIDEMHWRGPAEVGLTTAGTNCVELVSVDPPSDGHVLAPPALGPRDVVVISGGARGITAEVAAALAASFGPRLVLLGRTPAPEREPAWLAALSDEAEIRRAIRDHAEGSCTPQVLNERLRLVQSQREIRRNLERIRAAGAEVSYHAVDVRDRKAVRDLLDQIRQQFGPIRGLVHGAGVLADRLIEEQTDVQFSLVHDTKVCGLHALHDAIDPEQLAFLVVFSSSTARFGRAGQVAYAAANEAINKWAQRAARRLPRCRVVSLNWGPWDGGMVTASLKPLFEREGLGLIPLEQGASLVVEEISAPSRRPIEMVVLAEAQRTRVAGPSHREAAPPPDSSRAQLELVLERRIDLDAVPVIKSHVIDGHAVLPMALILEWLAEGALHRHPGLTVMGIDNLRLHKGVVLRGARPTTVSLHVGKAQRGEGGSNVAVEMLGVLDNGREVTHARGEVIVAERHASGERFLADPDLIPISADREEIYRRILFHGPAMQAIKEVEGCDDLSIAGWVSTAPPPASWIDRPLRQTWLTDPLAIDAAFQLLVLWCQERFGASSLPTAVGSYRQFRRTFPAGGVRVVAAVRHFTDHRATADIEFLDSQGKPVARIEAYECVIDPSLNQAFRRNRLTHLEVAPT